MYEKLVDRLRCPNIHSCLMDKSKISCRQCQKDAITEAADTITNLSAKVKQLQAELKRVKRERDAAIDDIPHKCWSCANGFYTEIGFDCDQAHYKSGAKNCLSWKWRGAKEDADEKFIY